jgi:hypothetical protein
MSNVKIFGTSINLWCIVRENRSVFKIIIGTDNDLFDLRTVIKEQKPNYFANVDPNELILWRVNDASSELNNKDAPIEHHLNDRLAKPAETVGDTFHNVKGSSIRVIVGISVTGESLSYLPIIPNTH